METWLAGIHRNYLEREYTIPDQLRRQVLRLPQTAEVCVGVGGSLATRLRRGGTVCWMLIWVPTLP